MTIIEQPTRTTVELATFDLYRDIHKGIRSDLFAVTGSAGRLDPSDRASRTELAAHVRRTVELLVSHAAHEDAAIQPALEGSLPSLAERVESDHLTLERRMVTLQDMADDAVDAARPNQTVQIQRVYLELASFTSDYLAHQDLEERVIMPALERAIGFERVMAIHEAIVSSIPPAEMAQALALMLPAMNVDNRTDLLGGMQAHAPAPVFEGVWGLARTVLGADDYAALASRLGIR